MIHSCLLYGQGDDLKKLDWLVGTWNQTNVSKPGRTSHEHWDKMNNNQLQGYSVTLQGTDTVFMEKTTILMKDNSMFYVADVPDNSAPVYFKIVELTPTGFVCENSQNEFPKKISYQIEGTKLKAQISGNSKTVDFLFDRKQ